jgi:mycofactocin system transcriptional regulator
VTASERPAARVGRPRSTTPAALSHVALQLFIERGFDATTAEDVAAAAGVGRRTLFRYFPSKNDLPWGDFDAQLDRMRRYFATLPPELPLFESLRRAVIDFNTFPTAEVPFHRERMRLLLEVPSLVAHSTLRYASWREVVADFVAEREGERPDGLRAQATAWACLGLCLSAYEQWLRTDDGDLTDLLDRAFRLFEDRVR